MLFAYPSGRSLSVHTIDSSNISNNKIFFTDKRWHEWKSHMWNMQRYIIITYFHCASHRRLKLADLSALPVWAMWQAESHDCFSSPFSVHFVAALRSYIIISTHVCSTPSSSSPSSSSCFVIACLCFCTVNWDEDKITSPCMLGKLFACTACTVIEALLSEAHSQKKTMLNRLSKLKFTFCFWWVVLNPLISILPWAVET